MVIPSQCSSIPRQFPPTTNTEGNRMESYSITGTSDPALITTLSNSNHATPAHSHFTNISASVADSLDLQVVVRPTIWRRVICVPSSVCTSRASAVEKALAQNIANGVLSVVSPLSRSDLNRPRKRQVTPVASEHCMAGHDDPVDQPRVVETGRQDATRNAGTISGTV